MSLDALTPDNLLQQVGTALHYELFKVGDTPITLSSILVFLLLFSVLLIVSRIVARVLASKVIAKLAVDSGTVYTFKRITFYLLSLISAVVAFQFIGINLSGLAVIFGLLSVGIGFGLQNVTSNFISGIILLFERPIRMGDRVTVGDTLGDVIAINIRSTTIRSLTNVSIIVPNSEFVASRVINWSHTDPKIRLDIDVGVSYNSDLDSVLTALREVAEENDEVLDNPPAEVMLMEFGNSSWNMQLRVWVDNPHSQFRVRSAINCAIVRKFRERNIEIPFPQRDLHVRSPLPVPMTSKSADEN